MLQLQTRVDELYESAEYERAYVIYRDELAAVGDKYAQYMVGYMILSGKGAAHDPIQASAWYRLAAERGTPEFIMVRDELMEGLNEAQRLRSDQAYRELRSQYCDATLLLNAIRKDLGEFGQRTGSRITGSRGAPTTIIDKRTGRFMSGDDYYGRIRQQLEMNLKALAKLIGADDMEISPESADIDKVEQLVAEYLEVLP